MQEFLSLYCTIYRLLTLNRPLSWVTRMRETIKDRMTALLRELGLTHGEFQEKCGLGGGFVSRISPMTRKSSFDKIKETFPQVNVNWLITGKGEMFGDEPAVDGLTVGERLHAFAVSQGLNDRQFERAADLANGYLTKASDTITPKMRLQLSGKFPFLNLEWLVTGTGNMLSACGSVAASVSAKDRLRHFVSSIGIGESRFLARCGLSVKRVDALPRMIPDDILTQIGNAYPSLNIEWLLSGNGQMERQTTEAKNADIPLVPFVPSQMQAEYVMRHSDRVFVASLPKLPMSTLCNGGFVAFEVTDNAMDDGSSNAILKGDTAICREIPMGELLASTDLYKDKRFAFVTTDGVLIRAVKECDTSVLTVTLHPSNSAFGDIKLSVSDIGKVLVVEWVLRKV